MMVLRTAHPIDPGDRRGAELFRAELAEVRADAALQALRTRWVGRNSSWMAAFMERSRPPRPSRRSARPRAQRAEEGSRGRARRARANAGRDAAARQRRRHHAAGPPCRSSATAIRSAWCAMK